MSVLSEFFSVPDVMSIFSGVFFLCVSLRRIMSETLLGAGLSLALFICMLKHKTLKCHLGVLCAWVGFSQELSLAFGFSVGASYYVGTLTCLFSGATPSS